VPIQSLARVLGPPLEQRPLEAAFTVVQVVAGSARAALLVDGVEQEGEFVLRPIHGVADAVPHAIGATVLPSGSIALVLAVHSLVGGGRHLKVEGTSVAAPESAPRRRILVADDSITTRTLEQSVLEAAGFEVNTAHDGEDAWERLNEHGADLLIADVEMPRLDGFGLCRRIRGSKRFAALPIVLVTGLASAEDRARGLDAGADAYIVKSSFDQADLLETVGQLLGGE
jgi:two-component system, chemotaxis family, sensor kinase CheA